MKTIIIEAVLIICLLVILYAVLQMIRNEMIYRIRKRWIEQDNYERWFSISYDAMWTPCRKNWFGLKLPKDKDFKNYERKSWTSSVKQ